MGTDSSRAVAEGSRTGEGEDPVRVIQGEAAIDHPAQGEPHQRARVDARVVHQRAKLGGKYR